VLSTKEGFVQSTKAKVEPPRRKEAATNNQQERSFEAGTEEQEHQGRNRGSFVQSTETEEQKRFPVDEHQGQGGARSMDGHNGQEEME
jgi:hypothetical protein